MKKDIELDFSINFQFLNSVPLHLKPANGVMDRWKRSALSFVSPLLFILNYLVLMIEPIKMYLKIFN